MPFAGNECVRRPMVARSRHRAYDSPGRQYDYGMADLDDGEADHE